MSSSRTSPSVRVHHRIRRGSRAAGIGVVVGLTVALLPAASHPPADAAAAAQRWEWPIAPPRIVIRGYEAPEHRYGPGHRGIDLEASPGSVVLSPADGVVAFVGTVVDRPVLSIDHADGLRSSFEPVGSDLRVGERVLSGQRVGIRADTTSHCAACLHVGARKDGEYLSPLALLGGIPRAVLLPLD